LRLRFSTPFSVLKAFFFLPAPAHGDGDLRIWTGLLRQAWTAVLWLRKIWRTLLRFPTGRGQRSREMKNSCQGCKRYWNHLHGKVTRFVRRMSKSSRHCMVMPERFANHFSGKMSRSVKLEGPNCILYDVGVTEHRNRKVLQSGWEVFVDANDIVEKDSLMFRYRGSSRFKVAVFDSSGCEKTVSCFGIGSTMSDQEPITNSTEMSSSSSGRNTHSSVEDGCQSESSGHCRKLAWTDAASSPSEDLPGEDSPYEHESSGSDDDTLPKMISTVRVKEEQYSDASGRSDGCQNGSSSHSGSTRKTAVISTPSAESGPPKDKYVLSSRSNLADAQKEKIDKLLQDIQSRTLAFVAIMRKSNVQPPYPSLTITKEYAVAHFPHESASVILQRPGENKRWYPRFYEGNDGIHKIRGEWLDFVCDNSVEEGDICIFVPAKGGGRFTFTVHLLRAESKAHAGHFVPPYMLSQMSFLSPVQQSIVEDKAEAIQLEAHLYVAIMNKTNVGVKGHYILEFGAKYAAVYLPKEERTILLQRKGKEWQTQMHIRNGRRLVLEGGWRKFVSDNRLRVGDICLFELKRNRRKLTMIVHIISRDQC
uniref:TF-B3 domain-containing protein n=8 Tax=Triticinae TaxID=1648030 RepID=A0A453HEP6_AEGTS